MADSKNIDCVVCGSCVVDILVRPFPLGQPIVSGKLYEVGPMQVVTGGLVGNSGATLARLGLVTEAFSFLGEDELGDLIMNRYSDLGIGTAGLTRHPDFGTSSSMVMIHPEGERSFAHCVGAPSMLDIHWFRKNLDLFRRSRVVIVGYFSLMPNLQGDLPELFRMLRDVGCMTVLEVAGSGGTLSELAPTLQELDIYIPSYEEACHQTGLTEVGEILAIYRQHGAQRVVGVKQGEQGATISPQPGEIVKIECIAPPGPVVDTTGAGDAFLAGFVAGTIRGLTTEQSGRLAAAAGACCVTGLGASAGLRDYNETARLAGIDIH